MTYNLEDFVRESNRIEGILRDPTLEEIAAHKALLWRPELLVEDMQTFVSVVQPGAVLRDKVGFDVRVGDYIAPRGGPEIRWELERLLAVNTEGPPYFQHIAYEQLHPFTDGNGRSGRALWFWRHKGYAPLGFLHKFYYDTLHAVSTS